MNTQTNAEKCRESLLRRGPGELFSREANSFAYGRPGKASAGLPHLQSQSRRYGTVQFRTLHEEWAVLSRDYKNAAGKFLPPPLVSQFGGRQRVRFPPRRQSL